ncbi:MAG: hypothetical protein ACSHXI_02235 [Hoeflea sp.]|uniref:hypothetical protein n=1 Tax=Hoeflea sp. TaxID=1940281 RepID=UPI003EFB2B10
MTIKDEIIANHAAGTLPQLFVTRIRGHRGDEEGRNFRAALVDLHNSGAIDVLEPARSIATSPVSQHDFFLVQNAYVEIIPELNDTVPAMLSAVKALTARAGNDLASGWANGAFRSWAENDDRARATIALIEPNNREDAAYLYLALQALAKTEPDAALDQAIAFLAGQDLPAQLGAAKAIGTLPLSTSEACKRSLDALKTACEVGTDDNLLGHILAAAVDIARNAPDEEATAVLLVNEIIEDAGDQTIHGAVTTLMFNASDLSPTLVELLTKFAHKIRIENTGTIEEIDQAAARLVQSDRVEEALALVVPIISAHEEFKSLDMLDSFAHALLRLDQERLAHIIVTWLLSFDYNLGIATGSLVGGHHGDALVLEFDAAPLALSEADAILLAHRTIGYLFMYPITVASIVLSVVETNSDEGRRAIEDILFEPLLINFSGDLANWLKTKAADKGEQALPTIKHLLTRLDTYLDGLRRVECINEFRPSERERLIQNRRQQESMRQAHKKAEKRSVLMSAMSRSVLLYGNRSISYFQEQNGKKRRNETKMYSFSQTIEAPRQDIIEPFELDYTLRWFRAAKAAT